MRERLVNRLLASRRIRSDAVASAFRAVPRHLFLPGLRIDVAYADEAVATKWENGVAVSSASQPSMMAIMLEQLDVRPLLPGVPDLGDGPHVQLWPHLHGTDAMFLALLRCKDAPAP